LESPTVGVVKWVTETGQRSREESWGVAHLKTNVVRKTKSLPKGSQGHNGFSGKKDEKWGGSSVATPNLKEE